MKLVCICFVENGVSIPSKYTSYLSPIQSSKLYNEVRMLKENKHQLAHFEAPYVVHQQNRFSIAPPQPVFMFVHPNRGMCYSIRICMCIYSYVYTCKYVCIFYTVKTIWKYVNSHF